MGLGLYDAAFGALGRIYGDNARKAITGITLIAGFASTVGWPLSTLGLGTIGWRDTCYAWAAAHMLFGLSQRCGPPVQSSILARTRRRRSFFSSVIVKGALRLIWLLRGLGYSFCHLLAE